MLYISHLLFIFQDMDNAARMVTAALLGRDSANVKIAGVTYKINAPTIKKIAGAGYWLSEFGDEKNDGDYVAELRSMDKVAKAVSWFIQGDEGLEEDLKKGTLSELVKAISVSMEMIGIQNFAVLSTLAKNVKMLIAKPRP